MARRGRRSRANLFNPLLVQSGPHSLLGVPLIAGGTLVGVLPALIGRNPALDEVALPTVRRAGCETDPHAR